MGLKRIIIGAIFLIGLGIYMYFKGSVMPESFINNSFNNNPDYELYRAVTFCSDVIFPFTLIFNLVISPYWMRKPMNVTQV